MGQEEEIEALNEENRDLRAQLEDALGRIDELEKLLDEINGLSKCG